MALGGVGKDLFKALGNHFILRYHAVNILSYLKECIVKTFAPLPSYLSLTTPFLLNVIVTINVPRFCRQCNIYRFVGFRPSIQRGGGTQFISGQIISTPTRASPLVLSGIKSADQQFDFARRQHSYTTLSNSQLIDVKAWGYKTLGGIR